MVWTLLLFVGFCFSQDLKKDIDRLKEKEKEYLKNFTPPKTDTEEYRQYLERLKPQVEELKKQTEEYRQRMRIEGGKIVLEPEKKEKKKVSMAKDEKLYILMSSSVPVSVWKTYAKAIDEYGLSESAFLVLRGCIGGCTYIKPTLNFIQKVIAPSEKEQIKTQVHIDPLIFRRFNIQRVPCFVYVKGDELINPEFSAGFEENLKNRGKHAVSCGDWAFEYHAKELCKKTGSPALCKISNL